MTLLQALRWANGFGLFLVIILWLAIAAWEWTGSLARSGAKTLWNTAVLFGSGFTKSLPAAEGPSVSWPTIWTLASLFLLWTSVFVPRRTLWMHVCAAMAAGLIVWLTWSWRENPIGWISSATVGLWFIYYWAAVWRR